MINKISKKQRAEIKLRSKIKAELMIECEGLCMDCGKWPDYKDGIGLLHLVHIIPLSQGGKTTRENCTILCRTCHNTKYHGIIER